MFVSQNALLSSSSLDFSHFSVPTLRLPALSALDFKHSSPRTFQLINWSFRTSSHQYHPMGLTLPLFSCSYALSCSRENAIDILFSIFRTLWQKHPGGGYPLQSENLSCSAFDPVSFGIGTYEQTLVPRSYRSGRFGWDSQSWLSSFRFHPSRITGHGPRVTSHKSQVTKYRRIRTYEKRARNPFGIRTSKTQDLKPFRMNTYRKTGEGGPHPSAQEPPLPSERVPLPPYFRYLIYLATFLPRLSSHGTNAPLARLHRCRGEIHA
jgi:hypothetical protein